MRSLEGEKGRRKGPKGLTLQGTAVKVSPKVGHLEEGVDKVRHQRFRERGIY